MRELVCTRCREVVTVDEEPFEFFDPALYVCGQCHQPVPGQLKLDDQTRTETRPYEPETAEIPF